MEKSIGKNINYENMKIKLFLSLFWIIILNLNILEQKITIEKQISQLFFDFDITKKPSVIEGEIRAPFDEVPKPKKEQNIKEFTSHPILKTKYKKGYFNVIYAFNEDIYNRQGLYTAYIILDYEKNQGQKEALDEYKNLVRLFRDFYPAQTVTTDPRDTKVIPNKKSTFFELKEKSDVPRLEIIYKKIDAIDRYQIEIKYTTTWDFKLIKGMERNIF